MADDFMFGIYKSYYGMGLFTQADLDLFVKAGDLSADQEKQILGTDSASASASASTATATSQA